MPSEFKSDSGGNKSKFTQAKAWCPRGGGQQHFGVVEGGWGEDAGRHRQMGRAQRKLWSVSSLRGVAESGVGTEGALGVFNAQVS